MHNSQHRKSALSGGGRSLALDDNTQFQFKNREFLLKGYYITHLINCLLYPSHVISQFFEKCIVAKSHVMLCPSHVGFQFTSQTKSANTISTGKSPYIYIRAQERVLIKIGVF